MAKLNRPNGKLFGSSATNIGVFGSGQGGETPTTSTNPDAINTLGTHWEDGWNGAVVSQAPYTAPFVEDMNAVNYVNSYNGAYLLQQGIPEYSRTVDYYVDSVCTYNGAIYICILDNPANNVSTDPNDPPGTLINFDPTDTTHWDERVELPTMNENEVLVGSVGGTGVATDTLNQGDIVASSGGLDIKSGVIVNADVKSDAAIAESKLSLDHSTDSLNTAITSHTGNTNNPHSTSISNLSDTVITSPAIGDVVTFDGDDWVNLPPSGGGSGELGYKNISGWGLVESKSYASVSINTTNWLSVNGSTGYSYSDQTEYPITSSIGMSISSLASDTMYYIMYSPSNTGIIAVKLSDCYIQASEPTFSQDAVWFDTNSNTFISGKGASDWQSTTYNDLCVPFCIIMNGEILQLFDRFASAFMDRLFLYPNQKMLFPHGRDTDGTFLNEVEYTVGSTNQMKMMSFIKSTYKGLNCLAGVSPATTYSKKANDVYITDQDTSLGAYLLPNLATNSQIFSTKQNNWFTSSDGIHISGTSFNSKVAYVPLYENEDGYITKIENKIFIDLATKDQVQNLATKYNVAYVGATPQNRTLASSTVYLSSTDNRNQVITASDGYTIVLPSDGIKAGDRFTFEWTDDFSSLVNPFDFTAGGNTVVSISTPNNKVEIVALVDNPVSNTDWKSGAIKAASTPESLSTLADTTITSPQNGELLQYDYANSKWINSDVIPTRVEINTIAYVGNTPNGHSLDGNNDVQMLATDNREQYLTTTGGYAIKLPTTDIVAGTKFVFICPNIDSSVNNTYLQFKSSNGNSICYMYTGNFIYEFVALTNTPTASSDWSLSYRTQRITKIASGYYNPTITTTANTRVGANSNTLYTFCPGTWMMTLDCCFSKGNPPTASTDHPWYVILAFKNNHGVAKGYVNSVLGVSNGTYTPLGSSSSFTISGQTVYCTWMGPITTSKLINVNRAKEEGYISISVFNTTATSISTEARFTGYLAVPKLDALSA